MELLPVGIGASLQVLLERFSNFAVKELDQISDVDDEIRKLRRTLLNIQSLVDKIDSQRLISYEEAWQAWLQDVTTHIFDAEDLLDEIDLYHTLGTHTQALDIVSFFKSWSTPHKICVIQKKLEGMLDEINRPFMIGIEKKEDPHSHATSQRSHASSFIDEGSVIGRNEDKRQIVEMLLSTEGAKVSVIPIVGMGGIGKTTLAQLVYNDKDIKSCFNFRIWVSVSVDYAAVSITNSIESVMENRLNFSELDKIQVKLQNILKEKRFLLVLDNMWNENISHNLWDVLRSPFSVGLSGSKVLVTTQSSVVSSFLTRIDPYHLRPLSDKDCWELIAQEALLNENVDEKKKLEVIGEKIAEKCEGLPLAAKTIGSALCFNFAKSEWQALLEKKLWDLPGYKTEVFPALRPSYNYLPACLKKCFTYCSIFPHKYKFQKDELVQLWAVKGFIRSQGVKRNEDEEEKYVTNTWWTDICNTWHVLGSKAFYTSMVAAYIWATVVFA